MEDKMSLANEFRIHGNLTGQPRRGVTGGGVTTAFYVVAAAHRFQTEAGTQTSTDFIPIVTYGKQAENDLKYLAKGKEVSIRGRIRSWYDSEKGRGGFSFEPDPGCVRYVGAPVGQPSEQVSEEIEEWAHQYTAHSTQFDVVSPSRPARNPAHA
jgi:single-strand DNA-binding protein